MIVITGASSGLGAQLAAQYDADGKATFLTGRSQDKLNAVAMGLSNRSQQLTCDLTSYPSVSRLFDALDDSPEMIIHCAGSGYFGLLGDQQPEQISQLIENNVTSAITVLREAVIRYQDKPINFVMVMSTAAQQPKAQESTYCAVKWAVKGLVESVRLELKGKPMNIIAVYPGGMATEFWHTSGKPLDTSSFMTVEDAATMMREALSSAGNGYVSDITINRR
ncbi:SDR family NAD(P)-dependent oxidoreductase [Vibrio sinaloensis]|uniref:SDR family NAD(P)-dependent oxidoreductase n=1 Tax=Photobacterium sp. (strain ATCC 43367) TaxID=379097 RepID=UPI002A5B5E78|nr:SDR family NAD(P)-dependent oxidoreductase [Vibrio sinaloensis]